jgi:hemoglobin-like flavoprotein
MKYLILALCVAGAFAAPLNSQEASYVQSTWNQVKKNEIDILYYIFQQYPDIKARFPAFVGKDMDALKSSGPFALHATRIVSLISNIVELMGNEANQPAIKTILIEMANNHKARGIPRQQFNEFRTALFAYMRANVSWGDNVEAAWDKAADNMFNAIFAILES